MMTSASMTPSYAYRFIYFDLRGVGELCRLTLAASGAPWQDIRYPMSVAAQGFSYGPEFHRDSSAGGFDCNMGNLPVLQIIDPKSSSPRALATVGQSHSIARFVANQHGLMGSNALEGVKIDSIYESCRDIKSAWYRTKGMKNGKQLWFSKKSPQNAADDQARSEKAIKILTDYCQLLERSLLANRVSHKNNTPWCLGTDDPSLADIAIYHLLGTPMSPVTGATDSFMDGESDLVREAYNSCPKIQEALEATAALERIKKWEAERPDTFT